MSLAPHRRLFDNWRTKVLAPALRREGAVRELARHLAGRGSVRGMEVSLYHILAGRREPRASLFLAIQKWLDGRR